MRPVSTTACALPALLLALAACGDAPDPAASAGAPAPVRDTPYDHFIANLSQHCGQAYPGEVVSFPEADRETLEGATVVVHFRECSSREVKVPVYVDQDASRTWVFTRTATGVDLRHDHRHPDGTPEPNTWYGAFVSTAEPNRHEFLRTGEDGSEGGWVVEIVPGERYTYGTVRDGEWRHRFDFDLSSPVPPPMEVWGHPRVGQIAPLPAPQEEFLANLARHCGEAFEGELIQRPDPDRNFRGDEVMTVHFRECEPNRMRIPFHVEDNRSRTWVLNRTTAGIDLRHDHRHEDGAPEGNTYYGAHTAATGTANRQEFLRPNDSGVVSGWAIEIVPGERYTYGTIRDGSWVYRIDFDLTRPVATPPAPWGH